MWYCVAGVVATLKEIVTPTRLYAWMVITTVVVLSGPFGTYAELPFWSRFAYWAIVIGTAILLYAILRLVWRNIVKGKPAWAEDFLVIITLMVVLGPLVAFFNGQVWEGQVDSIGWAGISFIIFLIGLGTVGMRQLLQPQVSGDAAPVDRLLARLDLRNGTRLARISSDDHHIRVVTFDGDEQRLRMRLRDAVQEVDVEPGFYVHRSHWVAQDNISRVTEKDGREVVELNCGTVLPVGPKYRSALVESGFVSS